MKNTIKVSLAIIAILIGIDLAAQQLTFNSQYMINPYLLNPAAAGMNSSNPISISSRQQWAGFKDAPKTQILSGQYALMEETMGIGLILYNDQTGPLQNIGGQVTYAYKINVSENSKLSFGLSGLFSQHTLSSDDFVLTDQTDNTLNVGTQKSFNPDASFGIMWHGDEFFFGISSPQLFENKYKFGDQLQDMNKQVRHYYASGGYKVKAGDKFKIEPSFLFKMTETTPIQVDANTRVIYMDNLWLGFSYRHDESVVAILGISRDQFTIGYSYDYTLSNIKNYSVGTHEIYLQYNLKKETVGTSASFKD